MRASGLVIFSILCFVILDEGNVVPEASAVFLSAAFASFACQIKRHYATTISHVFGSTGFQHEAGYTQAALFASDGQRGSARRGSLLDYLCMTSIMARIWGLLSTGVLPNYLLP